MFFYLFRWTGSDSNPGNNAGEGRAGTDRSNMLLLADQVFSEGKPKINIFGQYGRNYPNIIKDNLFLGWRKEDMKKLAILHPGNTSFAFDQNLKNYFQTISTELLR